MKSLLILLLGCSPLAALTAMSFLDLRSIDEAPLASGSAPDPPASTAAVSSAVTQVKQAKPLVDGLGEVDLLTSESLPGLKDLPEGSSLRPLQDAWARWVNARRLVSRSTNALPTADAAGVDQLRDFSKRLAELKAEYERDRPEGSETFVLLLGRQIAALDRRIARASLQQEADSSLLQVRAEFQPKRYGRCVSLCDQWLGRYAELDPAVTAKMRTLRDRAQFWDDVEQMGGQYRAADSATPRRTLLEGFLAKYPDHESRTAREQRILDQCQTALARLNAQLQSEALNRQAAEPLRNLRERPPSGLRERLQAAATILREYPTDEVSQSLRKEVRSWLADSLAEKTVPEQDGLLEAETRQGQILRGFFRKTAAPDGTPAGYQHFATYQEYRNPVAQVGTYAKDDLLVVPGASVLRQCASQYGTLRADLLEHPERKASWENLAAACERFESRLAEYRKKPGSSAEPLSFQAEARVARDVLAAPVWSNVEKLFGE